MRLCHKGWVFPAKPPQKQSVNVSLLQTQQNKKSKLKKTRKHTVILCACFHCDKPNRSLSAVALMRINLENEEAVHAYLKRSSCFHIICTFQRKKEAFHFKSLQVNCICLQLTNMSDRNGANSLLWVCSTWIDHRKCFLKKNYRDFS